MRREERLLCRKLVCKVIESRHTPGGVEGGWFGIVRCGRGLERASKVSFDEGVFLLLDSGTLRSKDCVTQRFQSYTPSVGVIFSGVPWKSTAAPTFTFTLTAQGRE